MCVILYKPDGVDTPTEAMVRQCFRANPHGAGIAIIRPTSTVVEIYKGFMQVEPFLSFIKDAVRSEDIAALHFRITTAGGTCPENCHPFPVSQDGKALKELITYSRFAVLHNGILGWGEDDLSDTQLYVRDELAPLLLTHGSLSDEVANYIAEDTLGSRLLILDGVTHDAVTTGGWYQYHKYWFSNMHWKGGAL